MKNPIELFSVKLIRSIDELNSPNPPGKTDHPNYTSFSEKVIKLDETFQNYLKKELIEDIIYKTFPLLNQEQRKQHSQCGEI